MYEVCVRGVQVCVRHVPRLATMLEFSNSSTGSTPEQSSGVNSPINMLIKKVRGAYITAAT